MCWYLSVRTIERAVSDLRRERRVAQLATVRVETAPGDQLQIDFGQKWVPIAGKLNGLSSDNTTRLRLRGRWDLRRSSPTSPALCG